MLFDLTPLVDAFGSLASGTVASAVLGLAVGFVSAFLGIGGGFVFTPYLHSVLQLSAPAAVATSMGQIPFMSLSGSIQYFRKKKIRFDLAFWLLLGSLPAAQIVALFIGRVDELEIGRDVVWQGMTVADLFLLVQYGFIIGLMGIYNLYRSFREQDDSGGERESVLAAGWKRNTITLIAGIFFGGLSALLGIGGGFLAVPFLVYLCGLEPVEGVATSLFAIFVTASLTTLNYVIHDQLYLGISLTIALGSVAGAFLGSRFAVRVKQSYILRTFGALQIMVVFGYLLLKLG